MIKKPELLSPAGDLERVKTALLYGADAVYLAGRMFGMRSSTVNFSDEDLVRATEICHSAGKKIYITCNILPHENDLSAAPAYFNFLQDVGVDALILADLGMMRLAAKHAPLIKRHVSTQFGVLNSESARELYELGVDTVVLARECSMEEIREIRKNTPPDLRLEVFVHGAMCVSFSGRCLLSNYLTGRDANHGTCAQPCRWKYHLVEEKRPGQFFEISEDGGTHILNSLDLCMIEHLDDLLAAGVDSLKIEGRMKSAYYTGIVTNAYRAALDAAIKRETLLPYWVDECNTVSHRPYCTGFYYGMPGEHYSDSLYDSTADIVAVVEICSEEGMAIVRQRNKFCRGDKLELVLPGREALPFTADTLWSMDGEELADARHAEMMLRIQLPVKAPALCILRKKKQV